MKKAIFLLVTSAFLVSGVAFTGVAFGQTGKGTKAKKDSTTAVKKPMPNCPGKTCGKKKG